MFAAQRKMEKKSSTIFKKLETCLSFNKNARSSSRGMLTKTKSWPSATGKHHQVAPTGCLSVYVGPEKQRFVIKTEFLNHPLFKMLLEDAELEYGFNSQGPLQLPCEVDLFYKVMAEMDSGKEFDDDHAIGSGYASCSPFSPARRLGKSDMAKGYSSYSLLTPSRLLQINHR